MYQFVVHTWSTVGRKRHQDQTAASMSFRVVTGSGLRRPTPGPCIRCVAQLAIVRCLGVKTGIVAGAMTPFVSLRGIAGTARLLRKLALTIPQIIERRLTDDLTKRAGKFGRGPAAHAVLHAALHRFRPF